MIDFSTATNTQINTLYVVLSLFNARIDLETDLLDTEQKSEFAREVKRLFTAVENCSVDRGLI